MTMLSKGGFGLIQLFGGRTFPREGLIALNIYQRVCFLMCVCVCECRCVFFCQRNHQVHIEVCIRVGQISQKQM